MKYSLLFSFLLFSAAVAGQDIRQANLSWSSSRNVNSADKDTTAYTCSFTTRLAQSIDWIQNNGTDVSTYTVNSVEGSWTDIQAEGQIVYHVSKDNLDGDFVFSRVTGKTSLRVKLNLNGKPNFDFVFVIDNVTTQP